MRNHTTASNGGLNQSVKFFVSANGQLQVAWSDSLHLKVLWGVSCKFEYLSGEVFKDSSGVDRRCGSNTTVRAHSALQESVDSANRELHEVAVKNVESGIHGRHHGQPNIHERYHPRCSRVYLLRVLLWQISIGGSFSTFRCRTFLLCHLCLFLQPKKLMYG